MNVSEHLTLPRVWRGAEPHETRPNWVIWGPVVVSALVCIVSGRVTSVLLVALIAAILARREARTDDGTLVVVGDTLESAILKGVLETRYRRRPEQTSNAERTPWVVRAKTLDDAIDLVSTVRCAGLVLANPRDVIRPVIDRDGRAIPVLSEISQLEHQLRRTPLDLVDDETWRTDTRGWRAISLYTASKRAFDLGFALVASAVLLPVLAITGLVLLATNGRPLFAGVPSYGRNGTTFRHLFLRTTRERDPRRLETMRQRPATGWLRVIRKTYFDLIPGLWNVIRGEMSLIGPRPEPVATFAQRFSGLPHAERRHVVRPGLVSLAQVRFRYTDAPRDTRLALEHDLYYVKYAGPRLDARILVRGLAQATTDIIGFLSWSTVQSSRQLSQSIADSWSSRAWRAHATSSIACPPDMRGRAALKATLLAGAGAGGALIAKEMRGNPDWGYWPVGYVDDDLAKAGTRVGGLPVLGPASAIPALVRREHIDAVVIAIPSAPELTINRIAEIARQTPAQVLKMPNIGDALYGRGGAMRLQAVKVTDVLGRDIVPADMERCLAFISGRRVLVTGAAGSIGREVARQVAQLQPELLIGLDINESDLFDLQQELKSLDTPVAFRPIVASITHRKRIDAIFREYAPEIVFHAAAYKHVPMMEEYPQEAIWSNTIGTYETARAAADAGVERFVLVSSDKAVRPSSVMGATKRLGEIVLRAVSDETGLSTCAVRFGNVLGSRGSVIPTFEKQIAAGGPVTITDPRMKRYFMTIPEAAALIIQAGAFGDRNVIYMLDMGEEIAIKDLAERMIRLHGLRVGTDIEIVYTGLRPGEKLREELSLDFETAGLTPHPKVRILSEGPRIASRPGSIAGVITHLAEIAEQIDRYDIRSGLLGVITDFDGAVYDAAFAAD